jgi:DNA-directed RNA polymerase specialized sigma24 family protein
MRTSPGGSRVAWTRHVRNGDRTEFPILTEVPDAIPAIGIDWGADRAVTELYSTHYRSLVRIATLLIRDDVAAAEEVVQDSFVAMHSGWRRLCDSDKALSYLRQSVVKRSRSALRHRVVADRKAPPPAVDMPKAEHGVTVAPERSAVVAALHALPPRQRGTGAALLRRYERGADRLGYGY